MIDLELSYNPVLKRKRNVSIYRFALIGILTFLFSCSDAMNHQLNEAEWPIVKERILNDSTLGTMERKYIVDQISLLISDLNEKSKRETFKDKIDLFSDNYYSQLQIHTIIRKNNSLLKSMLTLKNAETVSIDKEKGFIIMSLAFKNVFNKDIDFVVLRFEYEDDYGNVYFNETSQLSYQTAEDFNKEIEVIMTDIFKNENEFIFLNSNQSATEILQKNYGISPDKKSNKKDYLMEGLKVEVIGLVFKDGAAIMHKKDDWKYFE